MVSSTIHILFWRTSFFSVVSQLRNKVVADKVGFADAPGAVDHHGVRIDSVLHILFNFFNYAFLVFIHGVWSFLS